MYKRSSTLLWVLFLLVFAKASAQNDAAVEQLDPEKKVKKKAIAEVLTAVPDTLKKPWRWGIISAFTVNQSYVSNWAAGGNNAVSFQGGLSAFVHYENKKHYWNALLDGTFGMTKLDTFPLRKSQDYFEFNTKYGYKLGKGFSITAFGEFITQFGYGYDFARIPRPRARDRVSSIFAPAFLMEGIGVSYNDPKNRVSVRFAPLTGRQVVVLDPLVDEVNFGLDTGAVVLYEFGGSLRVNYLQDFWNKRITLESRLNVFYDYLNGQNGPYVNWRTKLDFKVLKVLSLNVLVHLVYDPNTLFTKSTRTEPDGTITVTEQARRLQFLQMLGVGIGYTLVK